MPLPATGYATATLTNPSSALTDFTLLIDLSRMPASWWSEVDTSDGTKGRAAKDDGTELPVDWIGFDNVAETGRARVKWSGTLATSGTQTVRIYPPLAANASVAANATYGAENAYDASVHLYVPLDGDFLDRTSNSIDGTEGGTLGTVPAGQVGDGIECGDRAGYLDFGANRPVSDFTLSAWVYWTGTTATAEDTIWSTWTNGVLIRYDSDTTSIEVFMPSLGTNTFASTSLTASTWHKIDVVYDGISVAVYKDGTASATNPSHTTNPSGSSNLYFGASPHVGTDGWRGRLDEGMWSTAGRSAAWLASEYAQTNDNATFWGTWTWNAAAGGGSQSGNRPLTRSLTRGLTKPLSHG